ncbi:MAG: NAD(P)H-binding protein [Flavobacteriales bacterium]|nr:NAD(P)H-binding protein [Flavobacteriales bacterium]
MSTTILLAGATGLVGSAVLPLLLADARVGKVVALVRRPLSTEHIKLEQWVGQDLQDALKPTPVDAVICCLGTTIKKAGSQAAFIAVDRTLPLGIARWAKAQAVPTFCIISAIGADAGSRIFYSRVKGEVEQELEAMHFQSLALFQPSVLTGPRKEKRLGEGFGSGVLKLAGPLLAGAWANYRVMAHDVLAVALVQSVLAPVPGTRRYRYREIQQLAG